MLIYLSMIEDAEDQNKFEQVYLRYKNLMFYVAHRILNDAQEVEDAVHDAFVRIAEHIDQVGEPDCPKTRGFVVIIVERVALNRLERRRRRSPAVRAALTYAKRAAIFVLAFVALSFSVRMTVDAAFRRQVLQVVVQVFSDFTEFRYTSDVKTDEQPGKLEFTYLPEGMVETDKELDAIEFYVHYELPDGAFIELSQMLVEDGTEMLLGLDTEGAEVMKLTVHDTEALGIVKGLGRTIHWTEGQFVYTLSGTVPMEELKLVAEGIRPVSESKVGKIKFGYLPEGMEIAETELDERDYFVWYKDSDGRFITLDQSLIEGNDELIWMLDTEDAEVTKLKVHNFDAIGIQKGADCTIHWTEGQIVYVLLGRNLPMEELKLVAEGIK